MGALAGLIAHHPDGLTVLVETLLALALVAGLGAIWLRERRRRVDRARRIPEMRD